MTIIVRKIKPEEFNQSLLIRKTVFVVEQKVAPELEFDEFEKVSHHYLAFNEHGNPIGTARWRSTEKGIKLERFAVLKKWRNKGVGCELVRKLLDDVKKGQSERPMLVYLHSQITAIPLYEKFGFEPVGEIFDECGILHRKMELTI